MDSFQVQAENRVTDKKIQELSLRIRDLEQWVTELENNLARVVAQQRASSFLSSAFAEIARAEGSPEVKRFLKERGVL